MSKLEESKERLADFRRWQNYCMTILVAVTAFVGTQYEKVNVILLMLCVFLIFAMAICIVILNIKIKRQYNKIREL